MLCLAIGCPHPDFLLEILSAQQLDEWRLYWRDAPFGFQVDQMMQAQQSLLIAASGGAGDCQITDFMPAVDRDEPDDDATLSEIPEDELAAMFPEAAALAAKLANPKPLIANP